jgi:hypothetical protein
MLLEHLDSSKCARTTVVPRESCRGIIHFAFLTESDPKVVLYLRRYDSLSTTVPASEMDQKCSAVLERLWIGGITEWTDMKDISSII